MILRRIEITLTAPDDYPEAEDDSYDGFHQRERQALFLLQDHFHIFVRQIRQELPDEYDIEIVG